MLVALVGGVLLAVLVVVTRGLLEQAASPAPPTRDELCAKLEELLLIVDPAVDSIR